MANVKLLVSKIDGTKSELSSSDYLVIPVVSSAPATAAPSGYVFLYALDSDNHIYIKDDVSVITDLAASGGGGGGLNFTEVMRLKTIMTNL